MIVAFAGEYLIYEPNALMRFDRAATSTTVYPGRDHDYSGNSLFHSWHKKRLVERADTVGDNAKMSEAAFNTVAAYLGCCQPDPSGGEPDCSGVEWIQFPGGHSKHFTFFFNLFVLMQIMNMICSRKIHDEFNIFEGFFNNCVFLLVWGVIVGLQFCIIQFTSFIFKVEPLGWEQWAIGLAISATVFFVDALIKLIPDRFTYAIGNDSVFDRNEAKRLGLK